MKTIIYSPDIECDSCERLLSRVFDSEQGITNFVVEGDRIEVEHEDWVSKETIVGLIENKEFRASLEPYERMSFKERRKHMKRNKHLYAVERKVIANGILLFVMLTLVEGLAYLIGLRTIENFASKYFMWLLYLNFSVALLSVAAWHFYSYKVKVTCMTGMMIGMTFGMQAGMMIGAVMGATNGFFVGAMTGMLIGSGVGALTGKCCGVMGVMEGMMAGIMGGTMGPMISVMMLSDNIHWFMPFYFLLNAIIVWGLSYMLYEELVEGKKGVKAKPGSFLTLSSGAFLLGIILMAIMVWGPKAGIVAW